MNRLLLLAIAGLSLMGCASSDEPTPAHLEPTATHHHEANLFRRTRDGIRHLYHVNAGWSGASNGYYLYVQNVNDEFRYTGTKDDIDYRSKVAYLIVRPK